jgi:SAM-dependent methyltransferase
MIETWTPVSQPGMDDALLLALRPAVARHPWWRARSRLVAALLRREGVRPPARVLDAGCGWGVTLDHLHRKGYCVLGLDASRPLLTQLDRGDRRLAVADLTLPLPSHERFDAILALDVIEHLDDDAAALRNLARLLAPGGVLIGSVPADPALFGEFDRVQGHRRRYTAARLEAAFAETPLALDRIFHWGAWLEPWLRRRRARPSARPGDSAAAIYARHVQPPPAPVSWALGLAFRSEQRRALLGRLRTGTSLFAVARRDVAEGRGARSNAQSAMICESASAISACPAADGWHQSR